MEPELSGFALGLLFGAAKTLAITTGIFGVAWWRGKRRIRELEAELGRPALDTERVDRLEQSLEYIMVQLDRLGDTRGALEPRDPARSHLTPTIPALPLSSAPTGPRLPEDAS